jgi:hypothetical protein
MIPFGNRLSSPDQVQAPAASRSCTADQYLESGSVFQPSAGMVIARIGAGTVRI